MPEPWFLLQSGAGPAAENMALDEALLEAASRLGHPILRFYGWTEPAATFGYFQKYEDVVGWTKLRPLMRRPTGGGLVPHDADWTYSLVVPPAHPWFAMRATESYQRMHEWIHTAFAELGVNTNLAPQCRKEAPGQCFAGAEKFDLLWRGKKIAGAAQRRNRNGLLIQGSVQPPSLDVVRADWEQSMQETAPNLARITWVTLVSDAALVQRARELALGKYSQPAYNERR